MVSRFSGGMPGPESATVATTVFLTLARPTTTSPPRGEKERALSIRLRNTCDSGPSRPTTAGASSPPGGSNFTATSPGLAVAW